MSHLISAKVVCSLPLALALASCATGPSEELSPLPGTAAILADTAYPESRTVARMFVAKAINGKAVTNSLQLSRVASGGMGASYNLQYARRPIPLSEVTVTVVGTAFYAMPLLEMFASATGKFVEVTGEIKFTPVADRTYQVRGQLGKDRSCIWIEDRTTFKEVQERICANAK